MQRRIRNFAIICLLGIISGFALMIAGNSLNFWLAKEGLDIQTIGVFTLVSLPYAINFIWAPFFDSYELPILSNKLGHRLSWILLLHFLLSANIFILSLFSPKENLLLFAFLATSISFVASAQDSVIGAFKTEVIEASKQAEFSGIYIFGYRIGMLLSSSGGIYFSMFVGWNNIYKIYAILILLFSFMLVLITYNLELAQNQNNQKELIFTTNNFLNSILKPIGNAQYLLLIIIFLILYRLADNFIGVMINPFLLHIGYNEYDIAVAGKLFGVISAIIGGFIASLIMRKKDVLTSLVIFGSIHTLSHMMFILQELCGKNIYLLFFITGFESITSGMTMAAYIAFIASLCKGKFRATQYAFFSSMMGVSRSILPAISGMVVAYFDWYIFYLFVTLISIPPLFIAQYWRRYKNSMSNI